MIRGSSLMKMLDGCQDIQNSCCSHDAATVVTGNIAANDLAAVMEVASPAEPRGSSTQLSVTSPIAMLLWQPSRCCWHNFAASYISHSRGH